MPQDSNIIHLPAEEGPQVPIACVVCQQPLQAGTTCKNCVSCLLDLAWIDEPEGSLRLVDKAVESVAASTADIRVTYDHYEICQTAKGELWELGRGAMGITYKATDTHLGSPVALKVIAPHRLSNNGARERFFYEARTAAQLRHPNIATIHHLGREDSVCFYAMEYIAGETLEDWVWRVGPCPPETALSIALRCARALQVAHERGFIHRDLKPSNIMLIADATEDHADSSALLVKLIDFGLVKALSESPCATDETTQEYFAGTPHYASPEQMRGREVDARSDIFSLGKCLWFMLTGECSDLAEVMSGQTNISHSRISPTKEGLQGVPACVLALVNSMTTLEKAARPQSASALVYAIQQCQKKLAGRSASRWWLVIPLICLCALATLPILSRPTNSLAIVPNVATAQNRAGARLLCVKAEEASRKLTKAKLEQAVDLYSQAIHEAPDDANAHAGLAVAYFNLVARCGFPNSQLGLAIEHAQRAIALDPASPKGYHAQAAIKTFQGRPWEALAELHHAIELDSKFVPAVRDFALLWNFVGKPQISYAWAKYAAQLEPANPFGWMAAGDAAADLGADDEAQSLYRKALSINPSYLAAHCGLMRIHILEGKRAQAEQDYALSAAIDPESELPLALKAQSAFFHGDTSEAQSMYRQLLAKHREGLVTYYGGISYLSALGFLRCQAGDVVEGNSLLEEAAILHVRDSDGPQAIYDLAAIRSAQGQSASAMALLRQAIDSGWTDYRATRLDPRFEAIRQQHDFGILLDGLAARVGAMRHEAEEMNTVALKIQDFPVGPQ